MLDLSWTEILVIGTAAIIFIGPKELPGALKTLGQWAAKARSLAREFQNNVDDMIRESELDKIKSQVDKFGSDLGSGGDLTRSLEQTIDPKGEINKALTPPDFSLEGSALGGSPKPEDTPPAGPPAADAAPPPPPEAEPPPAPPKPA